MVFFLDRFFPSTKAPTDIEKRHWAPYENLPRARKQHLSVCNVIFSGGKTSEKAINVGRSGEQKYNNLGCKLIFQQSKIIWLEAKFFNGGKTRPCEVCLV